MKTSCSNLLNMRRALTVGINHYSWSPLAGCVNDANAIANSLAQNGDGTINFHVKNLTSDKYEITKAQLFRGIKELFQREAEVVVFFFSGHGADNELGGHLVTQDAEKYDIGLSLNEVVEMANLAIHINEIIIIIDACYSGNTGNTNPLTREIACLRNGVSVLASSMYNEYSVEKNGQGLFTSIIMEALEGGAADIMGKITVAGLYNYVDKVLGPWQQRPVFKCNVNQLNTIKSTAPEISIQELRLLDNIFPTSDYLLPLSRAYEPTTKPEDKEKEALFHVLQKLRAHNLIEPIGEEHMYYAAIKNKPCRLTPQGKLYWRMVKLNKV